MTTVIALSLQPAFTPYLVLQHTLACVTLDITALWGPLDLSKLLVPHDITAQITVVHPWKIALYVSLVGIVLKTQSSPQCAPRDSTA
jgi:hypothetical protein